jgi:hypothetical protein
MKLWVDDIRRAPKGWQWLFTSEQTIVVLRACKMNNLVPKAMSLDHDLGGDDTTRPVVLWCCENDFWPEEVYVHSANPVGVEWLTGMIERYKQ